MARLDELNDPKKPTQVPDNDLADAIGKHNESDFNDAGDDEDSSVEDDNPDNEPSDFD